MREVEGAEAEAYIDELRAAGYQDDVECIVRRDDQIQALVGNQTLQRSDAAWHPLGVE